MNSKNLLSQLSQLESSLNSFSFEELSAIEARNLKKSYDDFKKQLELRIWGDNVPGEWTKGEIDEEVSTSLNPTEKLIATVSHEMRTPLTGIMGFLELLKESELTKNQLFQVNAIASSSKQLLRILNELQDYSKLRAGISSFETNDFNFYALIQETVHLCNSLMIGKDLKLQVDVDKRIPKRLHGSSSKLSQVLLNILGNSIKFSNQGIIRIRVRLIENTKGVLTLKFELSDTGIGIAEKDLKKIFNSFQQVHDNDGLGYGGIGLGLSVVKQIIEKQNGKISVESKLGKGTKFIFQLSFKEAIQKSENFVEATNTVPISSAKILAFEDNPLNKKMLEQRLVSWGCDVYMAENALFGLNKLNTASFDLVLLDINMPLLSGFEIAHKIRSSKDNQIKNIPIILITADLSADISKRMKALKINDLIRKPFSPEELHVKLSGQLKNGLAFRDSVIMEGRVKDNSKPNSIAQNVQAVLYSCDGDLEVLQEIMEHYQRNAIEFIGRLRLSIKSNDFKGILLATHKIKAGLYMLASENLRSIVENMSAIAKTTEDLNRMQFLYDRFVMEYPMEERALNMAMENLRKEGI
ncbi:ATP-binding protein [Eudoraea chungangensis]|uniref:ATP-binding protein n=1 Tax=Eudoraea chungangensis TaxID=1481905 RepID=UPI0023EBCC0B|nr:ATP-binding protein [Eudoraea chungangensis]